MHRRALSDFNFVSHVFRPQMHATRTKDVGDKCLTLFLSPRILSSELS